MKLTKSMDDALTAMAQRGAAGPDQGIPTGSFEALVRRGLARLSGFRRYRLTKRGRGVHAQSHEPAQKQKLSKWTQEEIDEAKRLADERHAAIKWK